MYRGSLYQNNTSFLGVNQRETSNSSKHFYKKHPDLTLDLKRVQKGFKDPGVSPIRDRSNFK